MTKTIRTILPFSLQTPAMLLLLLAVTICSAQASDQQDDVVFEIKPGKKRFVSNDTFDYVTVIFAGDVMQHMEQIESAKSPSTGRFNYRSTFRYIQPILNQADLVVANLEGTFAGEPYSGYPAFSAPDAFAKALRVAGINFLMTANNHCLDKDVDGLKRTLEVLDANGFQYTGTFRSEEEKKKNSPKMMEVNGIKLALLNYTRSTNGITPPNKWMVNDADKAKMFVDLHRATKEGADFRMVYFHWGDQYVRQENNTQRFLSKFCFNNGADLVVGSGPNVVQRIEMLEFPTYDRKIKSGLVAYSLGNFTSAFRRRYTDGGILFEVTICKNKMTGKTHICEHGFIPIWIYADKSSGRTQYYVLPADEAAQGKFNIDFDEDSEKALKTFVADSRDKLEYENPEIRYILDMEIVADMDETIQLRDAPLNDKRRKFNFADIPTRTVADITNTDLYSPDFSYIRFNFFLSALSDDAIFELIDDQADGEAVAMNQAAGRQGIGVSKSNASFIKKKAPVKPSMTSPAKTSITDESYPMGAAVKQVEDRPKVSISGTSSASSTQSTRIVTKTTSTEMDKEEKVKPKHFFNIPGASPIVKSDDPQKAAKQSELVAAIEAQQELARQNAPAEPVKEEVSAVAATEVPELKEASPPAIEAPDVEEETKAVVQPLATNTETTPSKIEETVESNPAASEANDEDLNVESKLTQVEVPQKSLEEIIADRVAMMESNKAQKVAAENVGSNTKTAINSNEKEELISVKIPKSADSKSNQVNNPQNQSILNGVKKTPVVPKAIQSISDKQGKDSSPMASIPQTRVRADDSKASNVIAMASAPKSTPPPAEKSNVQPDPPAPKKSIEEALREGKFIILNKNNELQLEAKARIEREKQEAIAQAEFEKNPIVELEYTEDTIFRVQFFALTKRLDINTDHYKHLKGYEIMVEAGYFKYLIGKSNKISRIVDTLFRVRRGGHRDAFIVAYSKGARVELTNDIFRAF